MPEELCFQRVQGIRRGQGEVFEFLGACFFFTLKGAGRRACSCFSGFPSILSSMFSFLEKNGLVLRRKWCFACMPIWVQMMAFEKIYLGRSKIRDKTEIKTI